MAELETLLEEVGRAGVVACGCYVLRYHPLYRRLKALLEEGTIGTLRSVSHRVRIGRDRMCHSFVRGPWGSSRETSPIFLSKCCHDVDILLWMTGVHPAEPASPGSSAGVSGVSSEGGLTFFRPEKAPEGAAERCLDCPLQESCSWSATDLYLRRGLWTDSFFPLPGETKEEAVLREVRTGRYGRCAFHSGNDVADWQRVTVFTREGVTLDIEMDGLSPDEGRRTILTGTRGRIIADGAVITVEPWPDRPAVPIDTSSQPEILSEHIDLSAEAALPFHAGADFLLMDDFLHAVHDPSHTPLTALPSTRDSLLVCFAASLSL